MAGALTISTLNNDTGVLATQNGMSGITKAWVNFNGTGTVAIRSSFNVSSITDNGTGDYTINFTTAMPNANYSLSGTARWATGNEGLIVLYNDNTTLTTSAIRIIVGVPGTNGATALTPQDSSFVFAQIFSS
jgi:hypothetical protein